MKKRKIFDQLKITKEKEEKARENLKETPLEKNDLKAIIIAAFITIGPILLIVVSLLVIIILLIFR